MAALLFKLSNVPDDEANDVRQLLTKNNISFYETDAGLFRMGVDAIWLHNTTQLDQARKLLNEYQIQRTEQQRKTYMELVEQGAEKTLYQSIVKHPFRFVAVIVAILFILILVLAPFVFL